MSRKNQRVRYHLDSGGITHLDFNEIKAILRAADGLIATGGRTMLSKILKGSKDKKLIEHGFDQCPVYGFYSHLTLIEISHRIDFVIQNGYLEIVYSSRLPVVVFSEKGWEIEKDTYSAELLRSFDKMLESGADSFNMRYLKDKNRELIWMLLDKVEASRDGRYIPILELWEKIDYKKVKKRIRQVITHLNQGTP